MRSFSVAALFVVVACQGPDVEEAELTALGGAIDTSEDVPVAFDVGAQVTAVSAPAHGVLVGDRPHLTYVPARDWYGTDHIDVTVSDGERHTTTTREIHVAPINDTPMMGNDTARTMEDTPLYLEARALLDNDVDVDLDHLSIMTVGNARHGEVALSGGMIRFVPEANYRGGDASFEYVATDGMAETTARVSIDVDSSPDAPDANDDVIVTAEDIPATVSAGSLTSNDTDADGFGDLQVVTVGNPIHGSVALDGGVVTFTPDPDYHGVASFEYTVSDGVFEDSAEVSVQVDSVNDAPLAVDDEAATDEDVPLFLSAAALLDDDADVDGALAIVAVEDPTDGRVVMVEDLIVFIPADDFHGTASFRYVVSDGDHEDSAIVVVTVTPVNDAPSAADDAATTSEDTPVTVTIAALLANDGDGDGDAVSFLALGSAEHGSVAQDGDGIVFTPDADFNGTATFQYTVSDGALTHDATVHVTVEGVNDAPVASALTGHSEQGAEVPLLLSATDVEGSTLSYEITTEPTHGSLSGVPPVVTYTPEEGFNGEDSFAFRAFDGQTWSACATVTITATPLLQEN